MAGVTDHGIRYPDGASKAKNLGPELKTMAEDIDWYIGSYLSPTGPIRQIIIGVAEEVVPPIVEQEISNHNLVTAIPGGGVPTSTWDSVPIAWDWREETFTHSDTYSDVYTATWTDRGRRSKKVPLLRADNERLPESVIPLDIARLSDIPQIPDIPQAAREPRVLSREVPIFAARVAVAKVTNSPVAVVFVGSSTTSSNPGYVVPLGQSLQGAIPVENPTTPQFSNSAQFTQHTAPGVHVYSAAQGGTTASDYLTDAECDRIAALSPALLHHMVGSNDMYLSVNPETYRTNMLNRLAYFDSVLAAPVQHVLVHQYERRDSATRPYAWDEYGQVLKDIAAERENTAFLDLSHPYALTGLPETDPLGLISGDGIHQSARGYALMADLNRAFYIAA